jgi:DNA-binding LacI/PurR family transcriptional regulator
MPKRSLRKHVIVAFPDTRISRVEKMSGIFQFLKGHNNWDIEMHQKPLKEADIKNTDGILLTGLSASESISAIEASDVPTVLIAAECNRQNNITIINTDAEAIGRQTAAHLISSRVYESFACVLPESTSKFSVSCANAFAAEVKRHAARCIFLCANLSALVTIEKPVAVFALNDDLASSTINECRKHGLSVPEDVAIIGFGNDAITCENHRPTISSVEPDFEKQGYLAAMHLERMMSARTASPKIEELVGLKKIASRESTHKIPNNESLVRCAMMFIKKNISEPISVKDVISYLGTSRRLAEIRFREVRNETILDAIRNLRLQMTKSELISSQATIARICERCGWQSENTPKRLFKERFGMTMSEYRLRRNTKAEQA